MTLAARPDSWPGIKPRWMGHASVPVSFWALSLHALLQTFQTFTSCSIFFSHAVRHAGSHFPDQGSNPHLLQWKHRILTTGPPGKFHLAAYFAFSLSSFMPLHVPFLFPFPSSEQLTPTQPSPPSSPLDCTEIKPVYPKGNQPEHSLEGLMLKLKRQYFSQLMWRADSFVKDPEAGKEWRQEEKEVDRGWDGWMASLTQQTWVWASSGR